jgi:hypothetical protein
MINHGLCQKLYLLNHGLCNKLTLKFKNVYCKRVSIIKMIKLRVKQQYSLGSGQIVPPVLGLYSCGLIYRQVILSLVLVLKELQLYQNLSSKGQLVLV